MPYTPKYLSSQQIQQVMALSKAVVTERSAGADFMAQDLDQIFDPTPEEQAFEKAVSTLDHKQKLELIALMQLGRNGSFGEKDITRLMDSYDKETDDNLKMTITGKSKTLRVYLEQAMMPPLHHRCHR